MGMLFLPPCSLWHSLTHSSTHKQVCARMCASTFASHLGGNVTLHFHLKGNYCINNNVYPQQDNIIKSYLYVMLIYIFACFIFSSGLICMHSFICRGWLLRWVSVLLPPALHQHFYTALFLLFPVMAIIGHTMAASPPVIWEHCTTKQRLWNLPCNIVTCSLCPLAVFWQGVPSSFSPPMTRRFV